MSINDWQDLFPHTIYHAEYISRDAYGQPNYGSEVAYRGRVTYKDQTRYFSDGSTIEIKGTVWIQGTPTVSNDDQITLPDGSTPLILSHELIADESGSHHVKIFFGKSV